MRAFLFHVPLISALLIATVIGAADAGVFAALRTERVYAWFVVVLAPFEAVLAVTQLCLWIGWVVRRSGRR